MSDSEKIFVPAVVSSSNPAEIANYAREIDGGLAAYIHQKCHDLNIVDVNQTLEAILHETTGNTVIAKSEIILMDGRHVSSLGFASTQQFQTNNIELLSSLAAADSIVKVISSVESFPDPGLNVPEVPVRRSTKM